MLKVTEAKSTSVIPPCLFTSDHFSAYGPSLDLLGRRDKTTSHTTIMDKDLLSSKQQAALQERVRTLFSTSEPKLRLLFVRLCLL